MTDPFNPHGLNSRPRVDDRFWLGVFWALVLAVGLAALVWAALAAAGVL